MNPTSDARPDPTAPPYPLSRQQVVYVWLTGFFVTALLIANIVGSKFFSFGTLALGGTTINIGHSVGMLSFPLTFLLTDLLNEYYGKRGARRVTYVGLAASALAFVLLWVSTEAPPAPPGQTFVDETMFDTVLGASGVMIFASMVAYLIGQLTDIAAFRFMKRLTAGKYLWLRATGSTVISQMVDSLAIMLVLYFNARLASGDAPDLGFTITEALKGYSIKFCIAVLMTPLIYLGRGVMSSAFGLRPLSASDPAA